MTLGDITDTIQGRQSLIEFTLSPTKSEEKKVGDVTDVKTKICDVFLLGEVFESIEIKFGKIMRRLEKLDSQGSNEAFENIIQKIVVLEKEFIDYYEYKISRLMKKGINHDGIDIKIKGLLWKLESAARKKQKMLHEKWQQYKKNIETLREESKQVVVEEFNRHKIQIENILGSNLSETNKKRMIETHTIVFQSLLKGRMYLLKEKGALDDSLLLHFICLESVLSKLSLK